MNDHAPTDRSASHRSSDRPPGRPRRSSSAKSSSSHSSEAAVPESLIPRVALHSVDALIALTVVVTPFCMGGRQPGSQLWLAFSAGLLAVAWSVRLLVDPSPRVRWSAGFLVGLLALGLFAAQTTPLSSTTMNWLAGRQAALLPLWTDPADGVALGRWTTTSFNPVATERCGMLMLAHLLLFVVLIQRVRNAADARRLLRTIAAAGAAMALFGLLQRFLSNGRFYWFYENPYVATNEGPVLAAFTNRNHCAQYLALAIPALLDWALEAARPLLDRDDAKFAAKTQVDPRPAAAVVAAGMLTVFALLLTLSRGGMVALAVGLVVLAALWIRQQRISLRLVGMFCIPLAVLGSALAIFGGSLVASRLDNWESNERLRVWQANLMLLRDFPVLGTGAGTHIEAYKLHLPQPKDHEEFSHAESSYMQVSSEFGGAGLLLAALAVLIWGRWIAQGLRADQPELQAMAAVLAASAAGHLVHAAVDFIWCVPGITVSVMALAAVSCRVAQLARSAEGGVAAPRMIAFGGLAAGALATIHMTNTLTPPYLAASAWQDYLKTTFEDAAHDEPGDADDRLKRRFRAVMEAAKHDPYDARTQLRAAQVSRKFFDALQQKAEMPLPAEQLRDAAEASQFTTADELNDWLDRAVGKPVKLLKRALVCARRSVKLCPLQGDAYALLNELEFLDPSPANRAQSPSVATTAPPLSLDDAMNPAIALEAADAAASTNSVDDAARPLQPYQRRIEQAIRVRPYSGGLMFSAGREELLKGNTRQALALWRKAVDADHRLRIDVIRLLGGRMPADEFLKQFEPDWPFLHQIVAHYSLLPKNDQYPVLLKHYAKASIERAKAASSEAAAAEGWLAASWAFMQTQQIDSATKCLQLGAKHYPGSYDLRHQLGVHLFRLQRYADAKDHLAWCAERRQDEPDLQEMLTIASKESQRGDSVLR